MKSKLQELVPTFTSGWEKLTFKQFLMEMSGSAELYEDYIGEMLDVAADPDTDWGDVVDIVSPIAEHVLSAAIEVDKDSYVAVIKSIREAWEKQREYEEAALAERYKDQEFIINENVPDVLHVVEHLIHSLLSGMVIKNAEFIGAADMRLLVVNKEIIEDLEIDEHEAALIRFLRTLDFDDLMDATDGIRREAGATQTKGIRAERERTGSALNAKGFMDRAERLKKLEVVLGYANKDYRSMVDPDGEDKAHE
ncbi:hypothetical protein D3C75_179050 [compost metagenome]